MAKGAERFARAAAEAGLSPAIRRFPEGTRTAADAARAVGCELGQIVKSLVFVADGEPFIALASGPNRADPAKLAAALGAIEVRRASPEEAREATGYAIGGTPPFLHARPLRVVLDPDLLRYEQVWAAAGAPDAVFPISPEELLRLAGAQPADLREE